MAKRDEHVFTFTAKAIAEAATSEAEYHESRLEHWEHRRDAAMELVEKSLTSKVVRRPVTGGEEFDFRHSYDVEAYEELRLSDRKVRTHRDAAERFRQDAQTYGSQTRQSYDGPMFELDREDVRHFRLGGDPRED